MKTKTSLAIIILAFFSISSFSQLVIDTTLNINSLCNKDCIVKLKLDNVNNKIEILLISKDSICLSDFRGLTGGIKVLNNKFIELSFRTAGGSNTELHRYVLICISHDKLYKAIDVISFINSYFDTTYVPKIDSLNLYDESSIYKISFILSQDDQNYKLLGMQSEKIKSKYDPKRDLEKEEILQFNFDKNYKIFYSQFDSLEGNFVIVSCNEITSRNRVFNREKYPAIKLHNEVYYFINNIWYIKEGKDHLVDFSNNCN
jgi:hypothetical protein